MRNNTLVKFTLTALAAFAISACGSSGGGDDNGSAPANNQAQNQPSNNSANNQQTNRPSQPSTNNQTQRPAQPSQPQVTGGTGGALVISGSDNNTSVKRATLNGYNTNSINVDGTNVTIGFSGIYAGSWFRGNVNGSHLEVCCGRYSDVRFGVSEGLTPNSDGYMFYNGNPTTNMPTSGSASYTGQSIISASVNALSDDYHTGTSKFNVDFGNKTLNGSLDIANIQPVNVNATISGNSFAGTANSASLPSSARVEGKFYGNAAKELAGLAQGNDNSWGAAFGAQKQ